MRRLRALRSVFERLESNYVEGIHDLIGQACQLAEDFQADENSWLRFCKDKWWKTATRISKGKTIKMQRPKAGDRGKALVFVLKWVFGNRKDPVRTASFYFRAVRPLIEEGIESKDIPATIVERGGLKELVRVARDDDREVKGNPEDDDPEVDQEIDKPPVKPITPRRIVAMNELEIDLDEELLPPAKKRPVSDRVEMTLVFEGEEARKLTQQKVPATMMICGDLEQLVGSRRFTVCHVEVVA